MAAIERHPAWRKLYRLLLSVPGVGPVIARTLIASLPELGRLDRRRLASLGGVAPFNRDSGLMRGKRTTWGGRADVRCALYMATLVATQHNPVLRRCYRQLLDAGKAPKVALTACMRKLLVMLNAIVREGTPWMVKPLDQQDSRCPLNPLQPLCEGWALRRRKEWPLGNGIRLNRSSACCAPSR